MPPLLKRPRGVADRSAALAQTAAAAQTAAVTPAYTPPPGYRRATEALASALPDAADADAELWLMRLPASVRPLHICPCPSVRTMCARGQRPLCRPVYVRHSA
jgi:hypothetical protein